MRVMVPVRRFRFFVQGSVALGILAGNSSTVSAEAPWSLSAAAMSASAAARTRPPPLPRRPRSIHAAGRRRDRATTAAAVAAAGTAGASTGPGSTGEVHPQALQQDHPIAQRQVQRQGTGCRCPVGLPGDGQAEAVGRREAPFVQVVTSRPLSSTGPAGRSTVRSISPRRNTWGSRCLPRSRTRQPGERTAQAADTASSTSCTSGPVARSSHSEYQGGRAVRAQQHHGSGAHHTKPAAGRVRAAAAGLACHDSGPCHAFGSMFFCAGSPAAGSPSACSPAPETSSPLGARSSASVRGSVTSSSAAAACAALWWRCRRRSSRSWRPPQ